MVSTATTNIALSSICCRLWQCRTYSAVEDAAVRRITHPVSFQLRDNLKIIANKPFVGRRTRSGREFSAFSFDQAILCPFDLEDLGDDIQGDEAGYQSDCSILRHGDSDDDGFDSELTELSDREGDPTSDPPVPPQPVSHNPNTPPTTVAHKRRQCADDPAIQAQKKAKKRRYNTELRNRKREAKADGPYSKAIGDRRTAESELFTLEDIAMEDLPVAKTGWQGIRERLQRGVITREEAESMSEMRYLDWIGDRNLVICDRKRRGVVNCIGKPRDPEWPKVIAEASRAIEKGRRDAKFKPRQQSHRRGHFPAEAIGYSHGGGQTVPANTKHTKRNQKVLERILRNPAVKRLSGVANSSFKRFCPEIYQEYKANMETLRAWNPSLRLNFDKTVFAATTINFGPQSVTCVHKDYQNYAPGSCCISSLGSYDDSRGGELILWTLKLIIRFPPGCTILLPSALIEHSNGPIQEGETRYSITQYSAAALFRFVANGFINDRDRLAGASAKKIKEWRDEQMMRWKRSVAKFKVWPLAK